MIDFNDLSLWNTDKQAIESLKDPIVSIKSSEGIKITDPKFIARSVLFKDQIVIAYHFCRCDLNFKYPEAEALAYLKALKKGARNYVMALDFEGPCKSSERDLNALVRMIKFILTKTGKEPYVYINESMLTQAKKLGYNFSWLWIAKWGSKPKYPCGMWQYTNRAYGQNLDRNHFMVDDLELLKRHEVNANELNLL